MIRRLIAPLAVAIVTLLAGQVLAQGAFPAPLPGKVGTANDPAFPPVNGAAPAPSFGAAPSPSAFPGVGGSPFGNTPMAAPPTQAGPGDDCMKGFLPLREEAEKRGKMIKAASDRHAPPAEACKLIENFAQVEIKMIKYIEAHTASCGIPPQILEQLKTGHKHTDGMQQKVCSVAQQVQKQGPAGPSLSDVLGSATALPEAATAKKSGGGTFDTLNGNVLAR
ncbi:MAG TPA: hypothetical protein VKS24_04120 [Bradyrhizobium sp.]|nr:hypothetical protein [Bradyrhizobium sp.]